MFAHIHHIVPGPFGRTREACLARAILSGFAATFAMLMAFLVAHVGGRVVVASLPVEAPVLGALRVWLYNLTHNPLIDAGQADVFIATAIYLLGGLVWAMLYALLFEPRLTGPGWLRGLLFSLAPALLSVMVFLPLVGGGLFGAAFDAGPLPTLGNFILHAIYGLVVGQLYGPFGSLDATTLGARVDVAPGAQSGAELMAARGLIGGLLVGLGIGIVATLVAGVPLEGRLVGQPVVAVLLASAGIGAAFGSTVGAFVGLDGHYDLPARP